MGGELVQLVEDTVGGDHPFEMQPQILARVEFGGAEGQPGDLDVGCRGRLLDAAGLVRRIVVPDEHRGYRGVDLAERADEGRGILLAVALADQAHQFARVRVEGAMENPPASAPADQHDLLLPPPGPRRAQRRELTHRGLVAKPDLPARGQRLVDAAD